MYKFNKISIVIASLVLINLTSCTSPNKNSSSNDNSINQIYLKNRTIDKNHKVSILNNYSMDNLGKYDYTQGVYIDPPIGYIKEVTNIESDILENQNLNPQDENSKEVLFTLEEVQKISDDLYEEYNKILTSNSNDYENYIDALSKDYINLENEYISLLNDISHIMNYGEENIQNQKDPNENKDTIENENEEIENKNDSINEEVNSQNYTEEEKLDILYREALSNASNNLDEFKPIQGQAPSEIGNNENINLEYENEIIKQDSKINSDVIFTMISENISLPNFKEKDLEFLIQNYNLPKDKISDFKIVSSENLDFELLIMDASKISDDELINSIEFRVDGILNSVLENNNNNFNLDEKVLILNMDNFVLFCFSNINSSILNFLQSI